MRALLTAASVAAALAAAAPAHANTTVVPLPSTPSSFGFVATTVPEQTGTRTGVAIVQTLTAAGADRRWRVDCTAEATGAAGFGVVDCWLRGLTTGTVYRPGADGFVTTAGEPLEGCMRSRVLLRDGSSFYETPLTCSRSTA